MQTHGTLVVGVGSPFGPDTLGWRVVDLLRNSGPCLPVDRVVLKKEDRPGLGLIEILRPYERAIVVDAVISGAPPGTLHHLSREEMPRLAGGLSTHDAGVADAVTLAGALGALPARFDFFGLEVRPDAAPGEKAVRALARRVADHLVN